MTMDTAAPPTLAIPARRRVFPGVRLAWRIWRLTARMFREKPLGAAGGTIFLLFLFCGVFADVLKDIERQKQQLNKRL